MDCWLKQADCGRVLQLLDSILQEENVQEEKRFTLTWPKVELIVHLEPEDRVDHVSDPLQLLHSVHPA